MSRKWQGNDTARPGKYDGLTDLSYRPTPRLRQSSLDLMSSDEHEHRSSREVTPINFEDVYQSPRRVFASHVAPTSNDWLVQSKWQVPAAETKAVVQQQSLRRHFRWLTKYLDNWQVLPLKWVYPFIGLVVILVIRGAMPPSSVESRLNTLTTTISDLRATQTHLESKIRNLTFSHGLEMTAERQKIKDLTDQVQEFEKRISGFQKLDERVQVLGDRLALEPERERVLESMRNSSLTPEMISNKVRQELDRYFPRSHERLLNENVFVVLDKAIQRMKDQYEASLRMKPNRLSKDEGTVLALSLTSPTYTVFKSCNKVEAYFRSMVYGWKHEKPLLRSPSLLLTQTPGVNQSSTCWPFPGARGTVGFKLAKRVRPTHFVVLHAPKYETLDIGSAPRLISVWAKVKSMHDRNVLSSIVSQDGRGAGVEIPPEYMKLTSAVYSVHGAESMQFYEIPETVQKLNLEVSSLVFAVESNWGNPDYTCLYGLGLYGDV